MGNITTAKNGLLVIVCAPSMAGKDYIVGETMKELTINHDNHYNNCYHASALLWQAGEDEENSGDSG